MSYAFVAIDERMPLNERDAKGRRLFDEGGIQFGASEGRPWLSDSGLERAQDEGSADVLRLCEAGRLLHVIGARFPLERIVQAHEAQESGKVTGNIVVEVGKEE